MYEFRDAKIDDLMDTPDTVNKAALIQNAVVITRIKKELDGGVYVIPEKIDGKTVIAVMDLGLGDYYLGGYEESLWIKKIVFPASIHTIWESFKFCSNLTDMYFAAKSIAVIADMFLVWQITGLEEVSVHGVPDCFCYAINGGIMFQANLLKDIVEFFGYYYLYWDISDGY